MTKPTLSERECVERLQAAADALASEGVTTFEIVGALVEVAAATAQKDRRREAILDRAANFLSDAAYRALEEAKKERAAKRNKSRKD